MFEPRVNALAVRQLAAWEELARDWPTFQVLDVNTGIWVERCASCLTGIWRHNDRDGKPYVYDDAERLALTVAHLRQAHADLDPDR